MRNITHTKKFIDPETVDKGETDPQPGSQRSLNRITQIPALVNQQQTQGKLHLAPCLQLLCALCMPGKRPLGCKIMYAHSLNYSEKETRNSELSFEDFISHFELVILLLCYFYGFTCLFF